MESGAKSKPRDDFYKTVTADKFKSTYSSIYSPGGFKSTVPLTTEKKHTDVQVHDDTHHVYQTAMDMPKPTPQWQPVELKEEETSSEFRFIGEALSTYLLAEKDGSIFIIDKHAAHERILFDELKAKKREIHSQMLLSPIICNVGDETAGILTQNNELLSEFGFEIDDFGGGSVAIRQIPEDIELGDPAALLEELSEKLKSGGRRDMESMRDDVLHTVACKAAIKAGKRSEPAEVQRLIARVLSGEIKYCPHGRPVSIELTKAQLDKGFKRT
jgi:DNA mismatch repair protein MutL